MSKQQSAEMVADPKGRQGQQPPPPPVQQGLPELVGHHVPSPVPSPGMDGAQQQALNRSLAPDTTPSPYAPPPQSSREGDGEQVQGPPQPQPPPQPRNTQSMINAPKHMRYDCGFCARKFVQKSDKVVHERVHTGERPYKCKYCHKGFTQKGAVVVHTRIHTGDKPFRCQFCAKAFSDKSNKVRHERVHTGETPYICSVCNKGYKHNTQLLTHLSKHSTESPHATGPKPARANAPHRNTVNARYECTLCPKKFFRRGDLALHQQVHYVGYSPSSANDNFSKNDGKLLEMKNNLSDQGRAYQAGNNDRDAHNKGGANPNIHVSNAFGEERGGSHKQSPRSLMQAVTHARERDTHNVHKPDKTHHEGLPLMDMHSQRELQKVQYMMPAFPSATGKQPLSPNRNAMHAQNQGAQYPLMNQMMAQQYFNPMATLTMPMTVNYHDFLSQRNPLSPSVGSMQHGFHDGSGAFIQQQSGEGSVKQTEEYPSHVGPSTAYGRGDMVVNAGGVHLS